MSAPGRLPRLAFCCPSPADLPADEGLAAFGFMRGVRGTVSLLWLIWVDRSIIVAAHRTRTPYNCIRDQPGGNPCPTRTYQ